MKLKLALLTTCAVIGGCSSSTPSTMAPATDAPATASATQSPPPTDAADSTASPIIAPSPPTQAGSCSESFEAQNGRVVFTKGQFGQSHGIASVKADGSDFTQVLEPGPERNQPHSGTEGPRWTPDGRIVFASNRAGGPDDWHVFALGADGGEPVQLTGGDDGIEFNPAMSPDGSTLVYAKAVTTPGGPDPFRDAGIFVSDANGADERQLTTTPEGAVDEWPDISPDGEWVVFSRGHVAEGGLYIVNIDGTGLRQLIEADFEPLRPRWSPDGQWIVLHSNGNRFLAESANVWVVAPDGSGLRQVTHESVPGQAWEPDWSPDGEHIVFVHTSNTGWTTLDVIGLDGAPVCTLWQGRGMDTGWDPDWGTPTTASGFVCPEFAGQCLGPLEAGAYSTTSFSPSLSYTVPAGWENNEDLPGNFLLQMEGDPRYLGIYQNVRAPDGCVERPDPEVGQTVEDVSNWLTSHPGLVTSNPVPVAVGGMAGIYVDISLAQDWTTICPFSEGQPVVPFIIGGGPSSLTHVILPGFEERLYLLNYDDGNIAIEVGAEGGSLADYLPDVVPIIESLKLPINGTWQRTQSCQEVHMAFEIAGLVESHRQWFEGYLGGRPVPASGDPCAQAVGPLEHSHDFTATGEFFSHNENGERVDFGKYAIIDADTLVFPTHQTEFGYGNELAVEFAVSGDTVTFDVNLPTSCVLQCADAYAWALSAFASGPWERQR